jgi:hypothetical protein
MPSIQLLADRAGVGEKLVNDGGIERFFYIEYRRKKISQLCLEQGTGTTN